MSGIFYAHSDDKIPIDEWQKLKDHLIGTAEKAEIFTGEFTDSRLGKISGTLHDIGKYSDDFQRRLKGDRITVDHSTAGAKELESNVLNINRLYCRLVSYVIAGHHSGLPDYTSLAYRTGKQSLADYSAYKTEFTAFPQIPDAKINIKPFTKCKGFSAQTLIRFLFSCLVDADRLNTEAACDRKNNEIRGAFKSLHEMESELNTFLNSIIAKSGQTAINRYRKSILADCITKAHGKKGLYTLTVPTGGGKTFSSLAFALKHARTHNLKRIIYAIPYTSIIEQNASVFTDIFGRENVLEHHSSLKEHYDGEDERGLKLRLAAENWDAPLVVTTNVQFFESFYSNRPSRCRKLHNIANSVIILDEAQMLPREYLEPCLFALCELVQNFGCTIVLCTATQPAIAKHLPQEVRSSEITSNPKQLYEALRRVNVVNKGYIDCTGLSEQIKNISQVLCIVNTKKHARDIFEKIKDCEGAYHLSANMCPMHRSEILHIIKQRLAQGELCRVVSTQLIEAGVDVDFPVVYRAVAGIDSIAQAAGRCNREGKLEAGSVYIFKPEKEYMGRGSLALAADIGAGILEKFRDVLSLEAVDAYFKEFFDVTGDRLDSKDILMEINRTAGNLEFQFEEISEKFKLIEESGLAVVIPYNDECESLLEKVNYEPDLKWLARKLQIYSVSVPIYKYRELENAGALKTIGEMFTVLADERAYDSMLGITLPQVLSDDDYII